MHDVLSGIKQKKVAPVPSDHQSLEKIGRALVAAHPEIPPDRHSFVFKYAVRRMGSICPQPRRRAIYSRIVSNFLKENQNVVSNDQSSVSRIGEQFLVLIDFLSKAVGNPQDDLQWLADDFLSTLHRIAVTGRV